MFQNHMLQLILMLASSFPNNSTSEMVRFKKKELMESLEPLQKDDVSANVIRGQYQAGILKGKPVIAYVSKTGITLDDFVEDENPV